jgi:hypothetical protein
LEPDEKAVQLGGDTGDLDQHAAGIVAHEPAQAQFMGEAEDKGAEPHTLYGARHRDIPCFHAATLTTEASRCKVR